MGRWNYAKFTPHKYLPQSTSRKAPWSWYSRERILYPHSLVLLIPLVFFGMFHIFQALFTLNGYLSPYQYPFTTQPPHPHASVRV